MAEISVTFKGDGSFGHPWVVVRGESVEEVSGVIAELRTRDTESELSPLEVIKYIGQEWREAEVTAPATQAQAMAAVAGAFPGAQEFPEHKGAPTTLPSTAVPFAPPQQSTPPCQKCGAPTKPKSGMGRNGAYNGFACTADKGHFDHIK